MGTMRKCGIIMEQDGVLRRDDVSSKYAAVGSRNVAIRNANCPDCHLSSRINFGMMFIETSCERRRERMER